MNTDSFKIKVLVGAIVVTVGILSLIVVFLRMPPNKVFINENQLITSTYGVSVYDKTGNLIFTVSPLNDYFYSGISREHVENKLISSNNGSLIQKIGQSIFDLFLGRKSLIWDTQGINSKGKSTENFIINVSKGNVEIQRKIGLSEKTDSIGQSITICPDCMVADDTGHVYFNSENLTEEKLQNASKFNLIPFIVGQKQSFPSVSQIIVLNSAGVRQMQIKATTNVFLDEKWHLIEFKTGVGATSSPLVTQKIVVFN